MEWMTDPQAWIALGTLTILEIVLGIDNIIFISILVGRLPAERRQKARVIGLGLAMVMRIALLLSLAWMMRLTSPLFTVFAIDLLDRLPGVPFGTALETIDGCDVVPHVWVSVLKV